MVANKTRMALVPPCRNPVYTRLAFVGPAQLRNSWTSDQLRTLVQPYQVLGGHRGTVCGVTRHHWTSSRQGRTSTILVLLQSLVQRFWDPDDPTQGCPVSTRLLVGVDQWQPDLDKAEITGPPLQRA